MHRRSLLVVGAATISAFAGCTGGVSDDTPGTARPVTTSSAAEIEVLVAQVTIREADPGPTASYQLRNTGDADATVKVEAVLTFDDGASVSGGSVVDVPAGSEVSVEVPIVAFDELSEAQRSAVRTGEGVRFETYLNGERLAG